MSDFSLIIKPQARYPCRVSVSGEDTGKGIIGIIPGSWETPDNWAALQEGLSYQGYDSIVTDNLPVMDPLANRQDWARAAAGTLKESGRPVNLLVAYSAGGVIAHQTIKNLRDCDVQVGHVAYLSASFGAPPPEHPAHGEIPRQRSSEAFRRSIRRLPDGRTTMQERAARRLLFGEAPRAAARLAIQHMQPQFRPPDLPMPQEHDVPGTYIWDPKDPVRIPEWVNAVTSFLNLNSLKIERAGHASHVSRHNELALILSALAGSTCQTRMPRQRRSTGSLQPDQK